MRGVGWGAPGPGAGLQGTDQGENRVKEKLRHGGALGGEGPPRRGSVRTVWTPTSPELPKAPGRLAAAAALGVTQASFSLKN